MDTVSPTKRRQIMRPVRSKDSQLEVAFRRFLWSQGMRYRKHAAGLFGKPNLVNQSKGIVIFLDSCVWHGCWRHCRLPSSNRAYWIKKIERNKRRDQEVTRHYKGKGWKVFRFWEHDLKDVNRAAEKVLRSTRAD